MAKKKTTRRVNKSAKIRDYSDKHPNAKPREIVSALAKAGIKVTPQQVSNVRSTAGKKKKVTRAKSRAVAVAAKNGAIDVDNLVEAKRFADKVGGVSAAKELIGVISKLSD